MIDAAASETAARPLGEPDTLPSLFRSADAASGRGQREFLWLTGLGLAALTVAGGAGILTIEPIGAPSNTPAIIGAIAFAVALVMRTYMLTSRPEKLWYDGRALAESAKTMAWRYAVRAQPFEDTVANADELFTNRIREIIVGVQDLALEPESGPVEEITAEMRALRGRSLAERQAAYRAQRIDDQRSWYASRARRHGRRARRLSYVTLLAECLGAVFGVLTAARAIGIELLPITAAVATALIGWERARQDTVLSRAYAIAAQELTAIGSLVAQQDTEAKWSHFVDQAEEAISREHTLWRASRTP